KGLFWLKVASAHPSPVIDLLPGSSVPIVVHLSGVYPLGPMSVQVHVTPAQITALGLPRAPIDPQAADADAFMWATPWYLFLLVFRLVGGFFGLRRWGRMRRGRQDRVVAEAVAKARRETIEQLRTKATASKAGGDTGAGAAR